MHLAHLRNEEIENKYGSDNRCVERWQEEAEQGEERSALENGIFGSKGSPSKELGDRQVEEPPTREK
ncbi:hypothetical protein QLX08_007988 [Tetragonisca angustula]|uniref:Uncharacterized protein n=1 Tax=Tetragonisca angustula TaxID=166442 RepID=A0AAW0ZNS8_9HYME